MKTLNDIMNILPEPIVIDISNISNITKYNIVLFGGYAFNKTMIAPQDGISVKSSLSSFSYTQTVKQSQVKPIKIGMIQLASTALTGNKVVNSGINQLVFKKNTISGSGNYESLTFREDPYSVKKIFTAPIDFSIDENSSIVLNKINSKESIKLYLFPAIPEMKNVEYADVKSGVVTTLGFGGDEATVSKVSGNSNYKVYRLATGAIIASAVVGLIYWIGKE